jgi:RCC1 and BTB domain-containing protein
LFSFFRFSFIIIFSSSSKKENGDVFTFGSNANGRLGHGSTLEEELFISKPTLLIELSNTGVIQIACGFDHTIALTRDGVVYTWGYGGNGKLGLGHEKDQNKPHPIQHLPKIIQIAAGHYHSAAVSGNFKFQISFIPFYI